MSVAAPPSTVTCRLSSGSAAKIWAPILKQSLPLQGDNANCSATAPQVVLTGFLQPSLRILDLGEEKEEEAERPYHSEATCVQHKVWEDCSFQKVHWVNCMSLDLGWCLKLSRMLTASLRSTVHMHASITSIILIPASTRSDPVLPAGCRAPVYFACFLAICTTL